MAVFDKPSLGYEINDPLKAKFAEIDATLGGSTDPLVDAENKGYIQHRNVMTSPIEDNIALFADRLRKHKGKDENQGDINVVVLDGSVSTDMDYASELPDQAYRPPMCTEKNLMYRLQEKLHFKEQQYRRFDAMAEITSASPNFVENVVGGSASTVIQDPAWDWQYTTPQPQAWRNRITRILTGTNPSTTFLFRNSYRRLDFLYSTDYVSSASLTITVVGGAGYFQVYDDRIGSPTIGTWVEAHNYVFSSREDPLTEGAIRTSPFTFDTIANEATTTYRKSLYQKRLKLKRTAIGESRSMTITSTDGGRLCYWGIQYSTNDYMFNFINSARGSHDIKALRLFEEWDVDYWKPDLILYSCNTINEMTSPAGGVAIADSPSLFANRFKTYIDALTAKTYYPEIFAFILFTSANQQPVDSTGRYLTRTIALGLGGNAVVLDDFYTYLFAVLKSIVYPVGHPRAGVKIGAASVYKEFMRYGINRARDTGESIFSWLFGKNTPGGTDIVGKAGKTGLSLTVEGTHPNDTAGHLAYRDLEKYLHLT